jgi:hypothetical protein
MILCWLPASLSRDGQKTDEDVAREGARVVRFQVDGGFEVEAVLHCGFVAAPCGRATWHAVAGWDTRIGLPSEGAR